MVRGKIGGAPREKVVDLRHVAPPLRRVQRMIGRVTAIAGQQAVPAHRTVIGRNPLALDFGDQITALPPARQHISKRHGNMRIGGVVAPIVGVVTLIGTVMTDDVVANPLKPGRD